MPERKIIILNVLLDGQLALISALISDLKDGWILNPMMYQSGGRAQPMRLENAVIYHLVKFSAEELEALAKERELAEQEMFQNKRGPRVVDTQKVSTVDGQDEVNALLKKGYTIKQEWSKETLLYLYEGDEEKNKEDSN